MELEITIISSLLCGLVSSFLTIAFTKWYERQNLAKALYTELSTLLNMYLEIRLPDIELKSEADFKKLELKAMHISQNYISVYENNSDKIGILNRDDIPKIIEIYMYMKYLIDSLQWLSHRWESYVQYVRSDNPLETERTLKVTDVINAFNAAKAGQDRVRDVSCDVLKILSKY